MNNSLEQCRMFLDMAHKDFKALHVMMDPDAVADEIFGFHVQQAVEKAIKAWLVRLGIIFPKTLYDYEPIWG